MDGFGKSQSGPWLNWWMSECIYTKTLWCQNVLGFERKDIRMPCYICLNFQKHSFVLTRLTSHFLGFKPMPIWASLFCPFCVVSSWLWLCPYLNLIVVTKCIAFHLYSCAQLTWSVTDMNIFNKIFMSSAVSGSGLLFLYDTFLDLSVQVLLMGLCQMLIEREWLQIDKFQIGNRRKSRPWRKKHVLILHCYTSNHGVTTKGDYPIPTSKPHISKQFTVI